MSGSISHGKNDPSQSLQMIERPLLTADELKSLPKGSFVVMKTGAHPIQTKLKLFLDWGITFEKTYEIEEKSHRKVYYADKEELEQNIIKSFCSNNVEDAMALSENKKFGGLNHMDTTEHAEVTVSKGKAVFKP